MAFSDQKLLAEDPAFREKVEISMLKTALAIVGETPASPGNIAVDDKRHKLGNSVLVSREYWLAVFSYAAAAEGTLTTSSTDAQVETVVISVWDDIAGVTGAEAGA